MLCVAHVATRTHTSLYLLTCFSCTQACICVDVDVALTHVKRRRVRAMHNGCHVRRTQVLWGILLFILLPARQRRSGSNIYIWSLRVRLWIKLGQSIIISLHYDPSLLFLCKNKIFFVIFLCFCLWFLWQFFPPPTKLALRSWSKMLNQTEQ